MPKKYKSNKEMINELIDFSRRGSLSQMLIVTAMRSYAQDILAAPKEEVQKAIGGMVDVDAWIDCAREIEETFEANK